MTYNQLWDAVESLDQYVVSTKAFASSQLAVKVTVWKNLIIAYSRIL